MANICTVFKTIIQAEYHKVDKKLEKYNLVKGQASLLTAIKQNDGATQSELAELFGLTNPTMGERINKLEVLGYIIRIVDENNLRCKRVYITPEGKKAAIQCNKILNEFDESLFKGVTKKEQKQLEDILLKMIKNISK